jgi:rubredoxin-NAD+ reductase
VSDDPTQPEATDPLVIVGTGLAGYTLAKELRKLDDDIPLTLITADGGESYSKPMLSNGFAKAKTAVELVMADAPTMAEQLGARILTRARVSGIHPETRRLQLEGATSLPYHRLILALGADPVRLPLEGDGAEQVLSVNDLEDYARFRYALQGRRRIMILGAGLIGCEFANDLLDAGFEVVVADLTDQPLGRLLPRESGAALRKALTELGVDWHLGTGAERVDRLGEGYRITLSNGEKLDADVVLSAVGLRPRTQLAAEAGLAVNRGILANRLLQTSDPHIYALGDCAEVSGLVLPYVMPLMHAARALAQTLSGKPTELRYPAMPVVVKTPAHPVVVAPPPNGTEGTWLVDVDQQGTRGRFLDAEGALLGFALTGDRVAEKQAITKLLPPVLP